jgi:hypothetical protein
MPELWALVLMVAFVLLSTIKILREWERGVVLRLGLFQAVRGPGMTAVIPLLERMYRVSTRVVTVDVPPPGHYHERQYHSEGQRRRLLSHTAPERGDSSRRCVFRSHLSEGVNDAAHCVGAGGAR